MRQLPSLAGLVPVGATLLAASAGLASPSPAGSNKNNNMQDYFLEQSTDNIPEKKEIIHHLYISLSKHTIIIFKIQSMRVAMIKNNVLFKDFFSFFFLVGVDNFINLKFFGLRPRDEVHRNLIHRFYHIIKYHIHTQTHKNLLIANNFKVRV